MAEALGTITEIRPRAARRMLAARGSAPMPPADSLRRWNPMVIPTWTPITGTVRTRIETGQLRLVRNSAIRRLLATLDGRVAAVERRRQDNDLPLRRRRGCGRRRCSRTCAPGRWTSPPPEEQENGTGWWRSIDYPAPLGDPRWMERFATCHLGQNNYFGSLQLMLEPLMALPKLLMRELAPR